MILETHFRGFSANFRHFWACWVPKLKKSTLTLKNERESIPLKLPRLGVPGVIWKMVQNDQICCFRPRNDMETCQKYFYSAFWALPQLQSEYFGGKTIWIHLATMRFSLIFNGISGIFQVDFLGVGVGLIFWPQNRDFSKSTSFLDVSGWVLAV